jgi:hypothetical protein
MSPTKFEVEKAWIEREIESARSAGDLLRLQAAAAEATRLLRQYYG